VKVAGQDYNQLALCDVSAEEASELALNGDYAEDLDAFCNDRFGKDMVMRAPLRAVEKKGTCKAEDDGEFCADFILADDAGTGEGGGGSESSTGTGTTATGTTSSTTSSTTTSATTGTGGGGCAHDECTAGAALASGCSPCVTAICQTDSFCCDSEWDSTCVGYVATTPACEGIACN
jgi:hypothetical protein